MLSNISKLEFQVGNKVYQFLCDADSPVSHAILAGEEFVKFLKDLELKLQAGQKPSVDNEVAPKEEDNDNQQ